MVNLDWRTTCGRLMVVDLEWRTTGGRLTVADLEWQTQSGALMGRPRVDLMAHRKACLCIASVGGGLPLIQRGSLVSVVVVIVPIIVIKLILMTIITIII